MKKKYFILYFLYINFINAYQTLNNEDFYNKIYIPTKTIYNILNITNNEQSFPQYSQEHNCTLDIESINLIHRLLEDYINHINNIKNFNIYYYTHQNNVKNATVYSLFSIITSLILAVPGSLINIGQISCHEYECDEKDYLILEVKDSLNNNDIYCAQKGVDYNCLKYNYQILGLNNLLQNHQYSPGCDRKLLDEMIGENILLGTHSSNKDISCILAFALIPYIPSLMVLLPNLYFTPKSMYSYIKLNLLKKRTQTHNNFEEELKNAIFNDLVEKIKYDQMNEVFKQIILHVLVFNQVAIDNNTQLEAPLLEEHRHILEQPNYFKKLLKCFYK